MPTKRFVSTLFLVTGLALLVAALVPKFRGGHLERNYISLAGVFVILAGALRHRSRRTEMR